MQPTSIGRYRLLAPIGYGGMGAVYRAHDEVLGRVVALKTLRARDDDRAPSETRRQRFEREARAAAALNHPHIATLYDFGEAEVDGVPTLFLAMEHVEGDDLSARLRDDPPDPERALEWAEQICSALQASHAAGIVHRDLKPSNVRITLDGRVKVLDFGIAKILDDSPTARLPAGRDPETLTGVILGTLGYIAPEQLRGQRLDGRADLFSLGAILHEMLAGERAFPNTSVAEYLLAVERGDPPVLPEQVRNQVPGAQDLLARLLARSPEDRPPDATGVRRALHSLREALQARATPSRRSVLHRAAPWIAGAAILLAAAAGTWWLAPWRSRSAVDTPPLRLAVMPFLNDTGDPDQEALALGLGFFLSSRLRGLPRVEVLGSSRIVGYPQTPDGERRLLEEQDVDRAVQGRLTVDAARLALTIQVHDPRNARLLREATFEADREDPLHLQEKAFGFVAEVLERAPGARLRTTDSNQAYRRYVVAQQFLESDAGLEDLDTAIHHLEQALVVDERFAFAHQALADALLRRHYLDHDAHTLTRAVAAAESAVAFDPELPQAMRTLARALRAAGRIAEAEDWLRQAQRLDGRPEPPAPGLEGAGITLADDAQVERARTLLELGRTHAAAGRADEARAQIGEAISMAPDWWLGWHALGVLEMRQGRYAEAREALEQAQRLAPERTEPVENLTLLHLMLGDHAAAIAVYEEFGGPVADAVLASNIGAAYFEAGDIARAEEYFVLATRLQPGNEKLRVNLGDALRRQGKDPAATHQYQVAESLIDERLEAFPVDADLLSLRALVAAKLGRCDETVASAAELEQLLPAGGERLGQLAMGYALCDRPDDAMRLLGHAVRAGVPAAILAGADELSSLRGDPRFQALFGSGSQAF
jgi:tetratricopeptide (TPR) repeat protein/tRNA A-37 threonylcarbamoyl transferase component Bud32